MLMLKIDTNNFFVRCEVLTTANIKIPICLDVPPCSLVEGTNVLEEPAASIFKVQESYKMEAECCAEMLVTVYQTTRGHIPEDGDLRSYSAVQ
jgi:hypothetical protein